MGALVGYVANMYYLCTTISVSEVFTTFAVANNYSTIK